MRRSFIRRLWQIIILLALYDLSAVCIIKSYYLLGAGLAVTFMAFAYTNMFLSITRALLLILESK